jgi:feruloyl-CoA synthase
VSTPRANPRAIREERIVTSAPYRNVDLGPAEIDIERRPDGTIIARSPHRAPPYPRHMIEQLEHWAATTPDALFLAQRDGDGPWNTLTYAQTRSAARSIASALAKRNLPADRPIAILSGNDLGQALIGLAAQYIGVPFAPISPAYSLMSEDFGKLRHIFGLLNPSLVYTTTSKGFERALSRIVPASTEVVVAVDPPTSRPATLITELMKTPHDPGLDARLATIGPDTVVKILFTSGSTGNPKGVINTQRMITSNQAMMGTVLRFTLTEKPVLVDWLPWSHTFGGNHNFNLALMRGGSFYIDDGRPLPGGIAMTARNLKEISPTVYFNVPRGYEALLPALKADQALAKNFFARLNVLFYAGASLPQHIWETLEELSVKATGERVRMITGLGSTETAPAAINSNALCDRAGMVGLPFPGVTVKLVPNAGKLELRLKGDNIMPGYWKQPELTKTAFDEEGYYKIGDALKFVDEKEPRKGFLFDGRVGEDFKLVTGTWVNTAAIKAAVIAAFQPFVRDAVIAGHDRGEVTAILIPDVEACRTGAGLAAGAPLQEIATHAALVAKLKMQLATLAQSGSGSSNRVMRVAMLAEPLSLDAGEMTDKGSINQRAVLQTRAAYVEALYAGKPDPRVITT